MLPFDMNVITAPMSVGSLMFAPFVKDFDPTVEKLAFARSKNDADNVIFIQDLLDGSGVEVEIGGRLQVTLLGCTADELPEDCLTFESED